MNGALLDGTSSPLSRSDDVGTSPASANTLWLQGGGEMGELIRAHDWSATPLGPILSWPQSLRTIVSLMLESRQPVYVAWGAGLTLLYNDSFRSLLGARHPATLGEAHHAAGQSAASGGQLESHIDGFIFSRTPIRSEAGEVAGFYCSGAEAAGHAPTAERLRQVQEAARIGSFEFDRTTGQAAASPEYMELYGLPGTRSNALSYEEWIGFVHPEDRLRIEAETRAAVADPARHQLEYDFRITRADTGEMRWITARTKLIRDAHGRFVRSLGAQWDITADKRAEAALRESEERYRSFITRSSEGIWLLEFDPPLDTSLPVEKQIDLAYRQGRFVDCNDAMARMYGLERAEDLVGKTLEFPLPSADPEARAYLAAVILSGYSVTGAESGELDAAGNRRYFDNSMIGIIENGQLKRLWGIQRDITDRKTAEEQRTLLINELNHRVKNTLATVQSIASQTLRNTGTARETKEALEGRLIALARAHDVLTQENWEGAELKEIIVQALAPYMALEEGRLAITGPEVRLAPRIALALSMALQELTTNAVKYGALSNRTGRVDITWDTESTEGGSRLHLRWQESGGPHVQAPTHQGFGSRLIERSLARELNGDVRIEFRPEGVLCTLNAPLS